MLEKIIEHNTVEQDRGGETFHLRSLQVVKHLTAVKACLKSQLEQCLRSAKVHMYGSQARPYLHEAIQKD